ncbi:hypothetical protein KIL84_019174, partial [Mauremys mutica]
MARPELRCLGRPCAGRGRGQARARAQGLGPSCAAQRATVRAGALILGQKLVNPQVTIIYIQLWVRLHLGLRLVNGSTACTGRVEIHVLGAWGTLCDSRWDLLDTNVLCRQLDCRFAESAPGGGYLGKGTGSVQTDTFHCKGTEPCLGHCPATALGASQCSHDNDASVVCSG